MNEIKNKMIKRALEEYKDIFPCSSKSEISECFTTEGNKVLFWFNTSDESTHVMVTRV